jgi:hypothetical protein
MKCPQEKSAGYTVVTVLAAIVLYFVIALITSAVVGRSIISGMGAGSMFGAAANSGGGFDSDGLGGALQNLAKSAEEAGKKMESAQQSGNASDQAVAAGNAVAAILGGATGNVEALATDRMKSFLPATLGGLKQLESSASRNTAMGMQVAEAKARYGNDNGQSVDLEITDMGSAKGLMGMASWVNVEEDKQTQTGYEKTYKQGENMIHEEWDSQSNNGEYSVVLAQRFVVKVNGDAASADQLKAYVADVNLAGLAALRNEGVKSN